MTVKKLNNMEAVSLEMDIPLQNSPNPGSKIQTKPLQRSVAILNIFSKLNSTPFRVSFEENVLKVFPNPVCRTSNFVWTFFALWTCFASVYLTFDLFQHYKIYIAEKNDFEFILHIVWIACFLVCFIYQVHFLTQRTEIGNIITQVTRLGEYFRSMFNDHNSNSWNLTSH